MGKIRKSLFTVLLIGSLIPVSLAYGAPKGNANLTQPGTFPIVKNKITLTIVCPAPTDTTINLENNYFTKYLEEKTNISLKWKTLNNTSFKEQLYLMLAGGELPDIILTNVGGNHRIDKSEESQFGAQGLLIPLNKYIAQQSVWVKQAFKEQKGLEKFITTPDKKIYALPNIDGNYHVMYPNKLWINATWLKNLGLPMPKTTEEFYQVMKAFRDKDPNKNGKKDEIPLSTISKKGSGVDIDGFLMNAFTYAPGGDRLYLRNGKVVLNATQVGYKDGLKYLQKLYREGLIYKESFTQDQQSQVKLNENGSETVLGAFCGLHFGYGCTLTQINISKKWQQYVSLPPLKGPNGYQSATYTPYVQYLTGVASITRACKNPEAAFRLLDFLYSEEGTMAALYGRKGKEWVQAQPGEKGVDGLPAKWKQVNYDPREPEHHNMKWGQLAATYQPSRLSKLWAIPQNPYDPAVNPMIGRERLFYLGALDHAKYAPKINSILPPLSFSKEDVGELSQLQTTINDFLLESRVKFITQKVDIDKEWPEYLSQLNKLGLKRYLQIEQATYDKLYKK